MPVHRVGLCSGDIYGMEEPWDVQSEQSERSTRGELFDQDLDLRNYSIHVPSDLSFEERAFGGVTEDEIEESGEDDDDSEGSDEFKDCDDSDDQNDFGDHGDSEDLVCSDGDDTISVVEDSEEAERLQKLAEQLRNLSEEPFIPHPLRFNFVKQEEHESGLTDMFEDMEIGSEEDWDLEYMSDEDKSKQNVPDQHVSEQSFSRESGSDEDPSEENVSEEDLSVQSVVEEDVFGKHASEGGVSEEDDSEHIPKRYCCEDCALIERLAEEYGHDTYGWKNCFERDASKQHASEENVSGECASKEDLSNEEERASKEKVSEQYISEEVLAEEDVSGVSGEYISEEYEAEEYVPEEPVSEEYEAEEDVSGEYASEEYEVEEEVADVNAPSDTGDITVTSTFTEGRDLEASTNPEDTQEEHPETPVRNNLRAAVEKLRINGVRQGRPCSRVKLPISRDSYSLSKTSSPVGEYYKKYTREVEDAELRRRARDNENYGFLERGNLRMKEEKRPNSRFSLRTENSESSREKAREELRKRVLRLKERRRQEKISLLSQGVQEDEFSDVKVMGDEKVRGRPDHDHYMSLFTYGKGLVLEDLEDEKRKLEKQLRDLQSEGMKQEKLRDDVKLSLTPFYDWACGVEGYQEEYGWRESD